LPEDSSIGKNEDDNDTAVVNDVEVEIVDHAAPYLRKKRGW
jgi:hypothetical protein